jgi:hypothetical protein
MFEMGVKYDVRRQCVELIEYRAITSVYGSLRIVVWAVKREALLLTRLALGPRTRVQSRSFGESAAIGRSDLSVIINVENMTRAPCCSVINMFGMLEMSKEAASASSPDNSVVIAPMIALLSS